MKKPTPRKLQKRLQLLRERRKLAKKSAETNRKSLSKSDRKAVAEKTGYKCHVCGKRIDREPWEADHVKSKARGGKDRINNYLASCKVCNRARWHMLPEEIQWVMRLGAWARSEIEKRTPIGREMAEAFVRKKLKPNS